MDRYRHEDQLLADLEQQLLAPAVRRLRRRFCVATAASAAATVVGLALVGLAVLPVLLVVMLAGGLTAVAVATDVDPPRPGAADTRPRPLRTVRHPFSCSTKS